jgi:glycosyltransferase involved in cell wall biosynthesis
MDNNYPIKAIRAPLWDKYAHLYQSTAPVIKSEPTTLKLKGTVIDSRTHSYSVDGISPTVKMAPGAGRDCTVTISGIIYTSLFNPLDGRKNWLDMLSAFCWAMKDNEDATLIFKLTTDMLSASLPSMMDTIEKLRPLSCRVLFINGFLEQDSYDQLVHATHYIVNTAHGEGQCLPLMEFMSAGKPAIAPDHSAMRDYIDEEVAFVVESSLEPTFWPHDPRAAFRTYRSRIDWQSLTQQFTQSYQVVKEDQAHYKTLANNAYRNLQTLCSRDTVEKQLKQFINTYNKQ